MDDPLTEFEQAIVKAVYMDCIQQDIGTALLLQKVYTEHKATRMSARDVRDILRSLKTRHTKLAEYDAGFFPVLHDSIEDTTIQELCSDFQRV